MNISPSSDAGINWGLGGDSGRPLKNKYYVVTNTSNLSTFVPDKTKAERDTLFKCTHGSIVRTAVDYGIDHNFYKNTAVSYSGPCWSGSCGGSVGSTPACPSGFIEESSKHMGCSNPNDYKGDATIRHNDAKWMAFQVWGWGCSSGWKMRANVRVCKRPVDGTSYK